MEQSKLLAMIDYTLLKPVATQDDIAAFCRQTLEHGFKTVFVNPYYVAFACRLLKPGGVKVGAPIGFSLGGATTKIKVAETLDCIDNGAEEIDMLINLGALKSKQYDVVKDDIAQVTAAAGGLTTKVIIETALLTNEEKEIACQLIMEAGAHYVKTATGFNGGGATIDDIKLLKSVVKDRILIKAAGGIKTYQDAVAMIEAGASRLGTSNAVEIMLGQPVKGSY